METCQRTGECGAGVRQYNQRPRARQRASHARREADIKETPATARATLQDEDSGMVATWTFLLLLPPVFHDSASIGQLGTGSPSSEHLKLM